MIGVFKVVYEMVPRIKYLNVFKIGVFFLFIFLRGGGRGFT